MKKLVAMLGSLTFLVAVGPAMASHSWGKYHWPRSADTVTVTLGDSLGPTTPGSVGARSWSDHLAQARTEWDTTPPTVRRYVAPVLDKPGDSLSPDCPPVSRRVEVCNGEYGDNGWLGIASIWAFRNHISQAIVKVNDTHFKAAPYDSDAWRDFVMCQEVGHTFGLDHQDEVHGNANLGTCMDYTSDPSATPSNLAPNLHDFEQLQAIYGSHLDGGGGGGGKPNKNGSAGLRRVTDRLWVEDLGGGHHRLVWVLWAGGGSHQMPPRGA